jgi:AsmA protein
MALDEQHLPDKRKHRRRHWLIISAVTVVIVLLVGGTIVVARASAIATYLTGQALPGIEAKIGRKITIGAVRVRLFPKTQAEVDHFTVSGAGGEPPLVEAARMSATIELWPLVRSLGHDVRIHDVELAQPTVHLVRRPDGTWSYSEVMDRLTSNSPSSMPSKTAPEISSVDVTEGKIIVVEASDSKAAGKNRAALALSHIDAKIRDLFQDSARLRFDATLGPSTAKHNVRADLKLAPNPAGHVTLTAIALSALRGFLPEGLDAIVHQGSVTIDGDVHRSNDGVLEMAGDVRLADLSLRGKPAGGKSRFKVSVDPRSDALAGSLDGLDLEAEGTRLGGTVSFGTAPPRGNFDLTGDRLDLDAILGAAPAASEQPAEGTDWLPSDVRDRIAATKLCGHLRLASITRGALQLENLDARGDLQHGVFLLTDATARLYGGTLALSGSSVDLRPARPVWSLQAKLDGTDLGQSTEQVAKVHPLEGTLGGSLQLHGAGADWPNIRNSVTGQGALVVRNATFNTDLQGRMADAFVHVLQALPVGNERGALPKGEKTGLGDLHANFVVQDGWMRLTSPLDVQTPLGALHVDGRVGLDRALDLAGNIELSPQFVQTVTAGKLVPHAAVSIPIAVRGNASDPTFQVTMAPVDVARLLVAAGALPPGLGNLGPGIGGGPLPGLPLPTLPKIPGVTVPPNADAGAPLR